MGALDDLLKQKIKPKGALDTLLEKSISVRKPSKFRQAAGATLGQVSPLLSTTATALASRGLEAGLAQVPILRQ